MLEAELIYTVHSLAYSLTIERRIIQSVRGRLCGTIVSEMPVFGLIFRGAGADRRPFTRGKERCTHSM